MVCAADGSCDHVRGDNTADIGTAADAGGVSRDGEDEHFGCRRDKIGLDGGMKGEGQEKVELVRRDDQPLNGIYTFTDNNSSFSWVH